MSAAGPAMQEEESPISALSDDCLGLVFDHIQGKERASQLALVCKLWKEVERTSYQPGHLTLENSDFVPPGKIPWLLRNTGRLRSVKCLPKYDREVHPLASSLGHLLEHLTSSAPNLRILELVPCVPPSRWDSSGRWPWCDDLFPLLIGLTQLQSLSLANLTVDGIEFPWKFGIDELTTLQNLKVLHLRNITWYDTKAYDEDEESQRVATFNQLLWAISGLPKLTSLVLRDVECSNPLQTDDVGHLTNLRDLEMINLFTAEDEPQLTLTQLTELTGLAFLADGQSRALRLGSLPGLKELEVWTPDRDYVLPANASVTKLAVFHIKEHTRNLGKLLPPAALEGVNELTLAFFFKAGLSVIPIWPAPWSSLTSLSIHCCGAQWKGVPNCYMFPPLEELNAFLSLTTVRHLRLTLTCFSLDRLKEDILHALDAFDCISMEVQIDVVNQVDSAVNGEGKGAYNVGEDDERVVQFCRTLCRGMPLLCTIPEHGEKPDWLHNCHVIVQMAFSVQA